MKKLIIIILFLLPLKFYGQCYTFILNITPESCTGCCDGSASVVGLVGTGCPPYLFTWSGGFEMGSSTSNLCAGSYTVLIQDNGGCCPDSTTSFYVDVSTGVNSLSKLSIKTYINQNNLEIENLVINDLVELYDIAGRIVFSSKSRSASEKINLSSLGKQICFLLITDKENNIIFRKKIAW